MQIHSYLLLFTIEVEPGGRLPEIEEIRNGVWDALPKEWQDHDYDGYALKGIDSMGELSR